MIVRGLKAARFEFTDMMNAARDGEPVIILEIGHDRKANTGYMLVRITEEELKRELLKDPSMNIPAPCIPQPILD